MRFSKEWEHLCFSWEEKQGERKVKFYSWLEWVTVQVGWGGEQVEKPISFPSTTKPDPVGEWFGGQGGEGLLELGLCVCVLAFSCLLCVCFCCKLQTDVSSSAAPDQLEAVMRCCQNCLLQIIFSLCPCGPLFPVLEKLIALLAFPAVLRPLVLFSL